MTEPIVPSQDPWYTLPEDTSLLTPGVVIRLRPNPSLAAAVEASFAYQILYTTTDARHQPSWAVTTLFIPEKANGQALLSAQIPYNSPCLDRSPSWILYEYKDPATYAALKEGWWVNVPDHEGPKAAFGAETGQGYAVLDSIRAVLNSNLGLASNCKIAMWGFSGGAIASGFAAELQPEYAPELQDRMAGTVLGGPGANMVSAVHEATKSHYSGLVALSLLGSTSVFPEARTELLKDLKPEMKERFFKAETLGPEEAFNEYDHEDMWSYFHSGEKIFESPAIKEMTDQNWYMGRQGKPQMPLFVHAAVNDEIALCVNVDKLVEEYGEKGVKIRYERNSQPGHAGESHTGRPRAIAWLRSAFAGRLAGDYPGERKVVKDVTFTEADIDSLWQQLN